MRDIVFKFWSGLGIVSGDMEFEKRQCLDEGRDFSSVAEECEALARQDHLDPKVQTALQMFLDKTIKLPMRKDYPYIEPSDLEGIRKVRGKGPVLPAFKLTREQLRKRLHGAWVGRCCGCLLGMPAECTLRENQRGYLKAAGQWPLTYYFRSHAGALEKYPLPAPVMVDNLQGHMLPDDDINFTVIGLNVLKCYGRNLEPHNVAHYWNSNVSLLKLHTAERIAYRNFANLIMPPDSATYRNVYREGIGAQIRGDIFGYFCPGHPELAADLAWQDGSISHVKNGIYGEMWVGAMLAAAFVTDDIPAIIETGLAQIPVKSRFYEAIQKVLGWYRAGITIDEVQDRIHAEWDERQGYCWLHTISNAMIVASALLWGKEDYGKTICYAVQAALDTDCNAATAGSVFGAIWGIDHIPALWSDPICDTLTTYIAGYNKIKIPVLVDETLELIDKHKTTA